MINSLRLMNFKPFDNHSFDFKKLTLLSGLNSTGKSSLLQSLSILRQSYQQGLLPNIGLALNGELVSIGTAQDVFCERAEEDYIGFEIIFTNQIKGLWHFNYTSEAKNEDVLNLVLEKVDNEVYKSSLFNQNFHHLQAERLGSRISYDMSDYQVRRLGKLGTRGEFTAHFLYINEGQEIPNKKLAHPIGKSNTLSSQVEGWMREISPGTRIKINSNFDMGLMSLQYFYGDSNFYRATNVGFGISYTLPIIVALLASPPGTLILLENPESHLHPRGQTKMGELISLAASSGIQVVVETHSDHVLNGIRLAVHGGKLKPNDVQLHYFQRQEKKGQTFTNVVSPRIDKNGRIDKWPDGFFDEWENSLDALLEPARE